MRSPLDGGFEVGKASGIWPPQASAIPGFATARLKNNVLILAQGSPRAVPLPGIHFLGPLPKGARAPFRYQGVTNAI